MDKSATHFDLRKMLYMEKAIRKLKYDGVITIRFPSLGCADVGIPIEVHCDSGNMETRKDSRSHIGVCSFLRKLINDAHYENRKISHTTIVCRRLVQVGNP